MPNSPIPLSLAYQPTTLRSPTEPVLSFSHDAAARFNTPPEESLSPLCPYPTCVDSKMVYQHTLLRCHSHTNEYALQCLSVRRTSCDLISEEESFTVWQSQVVEGDCHTQRFPDVSSVPLSCYGRRVFGHGCLSIRALQFSSQGKTTPKYCSIVMVTKELLLFHIDGIFFGGRLPNVADPNCSAVCVCLCDSRTPSLFAPQSFLY